MESAYGGSWSIFCILVNFMGIIEMLLCVLLNSNTKVKIGLFTRMVMNVISVEVENFLFNENVLEHLLLLSCQKM